MAVSLYDATVAAWLRILPAARGIIEKAQAHCAQHGIDEGELLDARLAPDMLPLAFQIKALSRQSQFALEGVHAGTFSPNRDPLPTRFADHLEQIDEAIAYLRAVTPDQIEALIGRDMVFVAGSHRLEFTAENFLLSFSMPNFYFHATTTYALLRQAGLPLGKLDFLGQLPLRS